MPRWIVLLAAVAVMVASCTGNAAEAPPGSSSEPPSSPSESEASVPAGIATVTVVSQRECCYIEGAYYFARLETSEGEVVVRKRFGPSVNRPWFQSKVTPGEYVLVAFSRPCSASCPPPESTSLLDEAMDVCREDFRVQAGDSTRLEVVTTPGGPCRVRVSVDLF